MGHVGCFSTGLFGPIFRGSAGQGHVLRGVCDKIVMILGMGGRGRKGWEEGDILLFGMNL